MRIIFVGYGHITQAILMGMASTLQEHEVYITGRNPSKIRAFLKHADLDFIHIHSLRHNHICIQDAVVFLTIKPYALASFVYQGHAKAILSALACVGVDTLKDHFKSGVFVRFMPNVAARFGLSATTMYAKSCDEQALEFAKSLLESFGLVVEVDREELIDASMATSGSSLAFLSLFAQSLVDAGVREGLKRSQALQLVGASFEGFAALLKITTPTDISASICTPGGATIEGLSVLEEKAVRGAIIKACHAVVAKGR